MIARIWRATATHDGAERYREHFTGTVIPELERLDGFQGALLLQRDDGEKTEIQAITRWASMVSVHDFAGDDAETAVVEPAARAVLIDFATSVTHHAVVADVTATND